MLSLLEQRTQNIQMLSLPVIKIKDKIDSNSLAFVITIGDQHFSTKSVINTHLYALSALL